MFAIIEKNENGDIDYPNFERSISKFFEDYRTFNENQLKKNALWKFPKNKILKSGTIKSVGDTCSCKGQSERTRSWKVKNVIEKIEVGKFKLKLESSGWSWKVTYEVGK